MQSNISKTNLTKPVLDKVFLKALPKVRISKRALDQIKYLCRMISKEEWSGVMFYSVQGSIKNPKKLRIVVEDILPMDRGTGAATEYDFDEVVVGYRMDNPATLRYKIGHIHSHNSMSVFFSSTDMSELNDNAPVHNYYFSLIVNNNLDMKGMIATVGKSAVSHFRAKDDEGDMYSLSTVEQKDVLLLYEVDIVRRMPQIKVDTSFEARVKEIMKPKPVKTPVANNYGKGYGNWHQPSQQVIPFHENKAFTPFDTSRNAFDSLPPLNSVPHHSIVPLRDPEIVDEDESDEFISEQILVALLTTNVAMTEYQEPYALDEVFESIGKKITAPFYDKFLDGFITTLTQKYFEMYPGETLEDLMFMVDEWIEFCNVFTNDYIIASKLVTRLEAYGTILESNLSIEK